MNRRAARRIGGAGAILALAVWMGGLPAAAANEATPDTTTAAAPAAPVAGGESVDDASPTEEPSVEPATPAPTPDPSSSAEPTPSPEPTTPDPSPSAEPTPSPEPTTPDPSPSAEPTPSPEPTTPGPSSSEPRQQPESVTDPPPTEDPGDADATGGDPTVFIGDFDCTSLTTTVTLDNSDSVESTSFGITVVEWVVDGSVPPAWERTVSVAAGAVEEVTVPLIPDAYSMVFVWGSDGLIDSSRGSCGSFSFDPRATVGTFDCAALSVPITLDNSRSTVAVTFRVIWTGRAGNDARDDWTFVDLAPGRVKTIAIALATNAVNSVAVKAFGPEDLDLVTADKTCGYNPTASVAPLDCGSLTTSVTLDNSTVPVSTLFSVRVGDGLIARHQEEVDVAAGATKTITVALKNDTRNVVQVFGPGDWTLTESSAVCGNLTEKPHASIGTFDCGTLTVPVTLDNSESTVAVAFALTLAYSNIDYDPGPYLTETVGAGDVRKLLIPLEDSVAASLTITAGYDWQQLVYVHARGPLCGLVTVSDVDCASATVRVTLDNQLASDRSRYFEVRSTRYPATGSFFAGVEVAAGEQKILVIRIKQLPGGGIAVAENWAVFTTTVHANCETAVQPVTAPTVNSPPVGAGSNRRSKPHADGPHRSRYVDLRSGPRPGHSRQLNHPAAPSITAGFRSRFTRSQRRSRSHSRGPSVLPSKRVSLGLPTAPARDRRFSRGCTTDADADAPAARACPLLTICYATPADDVQPKRTSGVENATAEHKPAPATTGQDGPGATHKGLLHR